MRKRFIEIKNRNGSIPVGASTQNITLPDGTILNDVLGDLNVPQNGSIAQRLNRIVSQTGESITNTNPHFKRGLYVDKYINSSGTVVFQVSPQETGESQTIVSDKLKVNGTLVIEKDRTNDAGTTPVITLTNDGILTGNLTIDGTLAYNGILNVDSSTGMRIQSNSSEFRIIPPTTENNYTTFRNNASGSFQFQIAGEGTPFKIEANGITVTNKIKADLGLENIVPALSNTYDRSCSVPINYYAKTRSDLIAIVSKSGNQVEPCLLRAGAELVEDLTGYANGGDAIGVCRMFTISDGKEIQYLYVNKPERRLYYSILRLPPNFSPGTGTRWSLKYTYILATGGDNVAPS